MTWRTVLGTIFIVATTIITAFWAINEPARMAEAEAGFHGRSIEAGASLFENNLKDLGLDIESDTWLESDESWDSLTDKLMINGYIKISSYVGAPSFFGAYYGFAPGEHTEKGE